MRPAPPLAVRCSPSRAWRYGCIVIGAAAGLAMAGWMAAHLLADRAAGLPGLPLWVAGLIAAALLGGWAGAAAAGPPADVHVAWDGVRWTVDGVPGHLEVMLDLDWRLLLLRHRAEAGGRVRWPALSFARGTEAHRALRATLYSMKPDATPEPPHVRAPDRADD